MEIRPFLLEEWFREFYFESDIVLCSSGVEEFTMGELLEITGAADALGGIVLRDSQSLGAPALLRAIARLYGDEGGDRIMVTHGSSEALFLVAHALLRPGDEVVVLTPCYQSLYSVPESIGCVVKPWPLRFEDRYEPDLDALRALLGPRTRMVVVNFPNNPTGATLTPAQLDALVDAVAATGAWLLWDGAFADLVYDAPPLPDPGRRYERTISTGTLSKSYGLSGLRVGWCRAPGEVLAGCVRLRDYVTLNLSPLIELLACKAIEHRDQILARRLPRSRDNRDHLLAWVDRHRDRVACVRPKGGVSAFLRVVGGGDTEALCRRLATEHGVFLLPGTCFGRPDEIRVGFGGSPAALREGLDRFSRLLGRS